MSEIDTLPTISCIAVPPPSVMALFEFIVYLFNIIKMPSKSNSWDLGKYRLSNWWYSQFIMDNVIMDNFIMDNVSLSFFEPDKFGLFCISFILFLYYFYTIIVIMIFITFCIIMNNQWPCCLSMTDQTTLDCFVNIIFLFLHQ